MNRNPSHLAKVTRPLLAKYFSRKRIFELLDRCCAYPVVLITGPAGSGKTTLVNSYLNERRLDCLWYQVDEGDADPATVFYYLRQAAKEIVPRRRTLLPLLTPEYQAGLATFTKRYFEQLYERMPHQTVIVFDNYQESPEASVFHTLIRHGLSVIPPGMHVVLISRKAPPAELVYLEANRQMATVRWNDLKLQPEETAGIIELLAPWFLSEERIREIHELSAGWMAGVVLMVQQARTEGIEPQVFASQAPEAIFDYFASEVLSKMDETTRDFLFTTACLPHMSPLLAGDLTGNQQAGLILSDLSRHNYFIERRFTSEPVYSYHPLFREFLRSRAASVFRPETMTSLITKAACLLERDGQADEALDLILEAGDWEKMVVFLMQHAPSMLEHGRHRSLEHWLAGIPEDILHSSPWLLFWLGTSRLPFDPLQGMANFEEAYGLFKAQDDIPGIFLSWSGIVNAVVFANAGYARLDELITDLEERRAAFDALPSDEIRARVASGMFTVLAYRHPEHPEAGSWAELALDLADKTEDMDTFILTMVNRSSLQKLSLGRLKQMGEDIISLRLLAHDPKLSEMGRLFITVAEANYYAVIVMHEQCLSTVKKGLELAQHSGIHTWDVMLLGKAAMSCQNVGDYVQADRFLDLLSSHEDEPRPWILGFVQILKARQALIKGDLSGAAEFAERVSRLSAEDKIPLTLCCDLIFCAQLMHRVGDDDRAQAILDEVATIAGKIHSEVVSISAKLIEAQIALDRGHDREGLSALREALGRQKETGYFLITCDVPASTAALCARALKDGIEEDFVKEIIRRRHLVPDDLAMTTMDWPWPVQVFTLGRFEVFRDGEPVRFGKKAQKKPLEMLRLLVAQGGSQVGETHIADSLWPDADGDLALKACTTTLHRLRRLLGHPEAILLQDGMLTIDARICWTDARAFEHLLDKAERLWEGARAEKEHTKACELTCTALDLYRGPFLAGETWSPEAIFMREHLHARYFNGLYRLGDYLAFNNEWDKARGFFEHGLEIDDCAEDCYRRLMLCLQQLGRRAEARAVFERCRRTLRVRLGVEPSSDTMALCPSLQKHPDKHP